MDTLKEKKIMDSKKKKQIKYKIKIRKMSPEITNLQVWLFFTGWQDI